MSGRWTLPPLAPGDMAPDFRGVSRPNPKFHFSTAAGRYVLMGFLPRDPSRREAAYAAVRPLFQVCERQSAAIFLIVPQTIEEGAPPDRHGVRWFFDPAEEIRQLYHVGPEGGWALLDPAMRVMALAPLEAPGPVLDRFANLPSVDDYAGVPLVAPALIVPRVFEPEMCRRLIDIYEKVGGQQSGVMRDIGGRTVGVIDSMKRRRDVNLGSDKAMIAEIHARIERTVVPMIARAYQFRPTRIERYIVACYDAADGGYFMPHRDNETLGTAHRRFACSINLNAEEFEGGDLRFPELGRRTYRPPTGGAVVFACNLQHEATPVTRGRRYAFLPFLYDEAGQAIRDRNAAFIESAGPSEQAAS
ncbi:2OG-Fe(II) oxygenase [Phenylobacterium sp.]|uniref:2OG-Fe(II) oxygenase n=1 Tax=Phenylobacterium sp. TaxID=1871053 RepID=UPI0025FADD8B|nr:2OG-Fe(II) oxygenase [Phenylobacterium sp.]